MKKILIILFLLFTVNCYADIIVIYNDNTKEIYTVSESDDTAVPAGFKKDILKGELSDYNFTENPINYRYENKKFIKDLDKVSQENQREKIEKEKAKEEKAINEKIRKMAIEKLKEEGVKIKYAE